MESMGSSSGHNSTATSSLPTIDEDKPLWNHVTKIGKSAGGGGNSTWLCNVCGNTFHGTYSRVRGHLLKIPNLGIRKCEKVNDKKLRELQREVEEAEKRAKDAKPKEVPLPCHSQGQGSTMEFRQEMFEPKKRKAQGNSAIEKAFNISAREELQQEIARMFYSAGLPFHLARNPHYVRAFTLAANSNLSGFVPPGYNALRTSLLEKERDHVKMLLDPIKHAWKNKGITIVNDGWSDPQRRPLINFIAVNETGPMFLKAVNCQGEYKDKYFISSLIKETIIEVGSENVVQVITDNAPVCQAAGFLVEEMYPHVFWTPCVVHTLNLALKNICAAKDTEANAITYGECSWITDIAMDATIIKVFITTHSMRLHMYNQFVKLKMLSIAETRFASVIIMLKRFKLIKRGLQNLVISDKWVLYREDDVGKAQFVKEKVLNDLWWDKVDYILSFTEPIYEMLRRADTDMPCLHLVYDMWDCMIENVRTAIYQYEKKEEIEESTFYEVVHTILVSRWSKSNTPLHCLAHSLNPRYYSHQWLSGGPNRVEPNKDVEISSERKKCLQRFFPNATERQTVNIEFGKFSSFVDEFSEFDSMNDRGVLDPKLWWVVHGASTPKLQTLATRLLGQPCSSSCSERNWSTYSFINSVKRNKLTPKRAEDLVYVHSNLRLLSRRTKQYKEGESKMWDVGGDAFDSLEVEGAGILEIANLSLDEPELFDMFLDDNNDDDEDGGDDLDANNEE